MQIDFTAVTRLTGKSRISLTLAKATAGCSRNLGAVRQTVGVSQWCVQDSVPSSGFEGVCWQWEFKLLKLLYSVFPHAGSKGL